MGIINDHLSGLLERFDGFREAPVGLHFQAGRWHHTGKGREFLGALAPAETLTAVI